MNEEIHERKKGEQRGERERNERRMELRSNEIAFYPPSVDRKKDGSLTTQDNFSCRWCCVASGGGGEAAAVKAAIRKRGQHVLVIHGVTFTS